MLKTIESKQLRIFKINFYTNAIIGLVYLIFRYWLKKEGPFGPESYSFQKVIQYGHIIAVVFLVFSLGQLVSDHIRLRIKSSKKRKSGLILLVFMILSILSGYGIQVPMDWRSDVGVFHSITSCILLIIFILHAL